MNDVCNSAGGEEADSGGETELSRLSSTSLDSQEPVEPQTQQRHMTQETKEKYQAA